MDLKKSFGKVGTILQRGEQRQKMRPARPA